MVDFYIFNKFYLEKDFPARNPFIDKIFMRYVIARDAALSASLLAIASTPGLGFSNEGVALIRVDGENYIIMSIVTLSASLVVMQKNRHSHAQRVAGRHAEKVKQSHVLRIAGRHSKLLRQSHAQRIAGRHAQKQPGTIQR
jgi:hypothetical protein